MVCPYAVNRVVVSQTTFDRTENGDVTDQQTLERITASFLPCAKEECGAWQEGRCQYRGT